MRTLIHALIWTLLLAAGSGAPAQEPAIVEEEITDDEPLAGGELADLERQAEELFADDDLEGALAIYRRLAELSPNKPAKAEALLLAAWIEHLSGRDTAAFTALTEALISDPDVEFRPELYTDPFRDLFREAEAEALERTDVQAYEAVDQGLVHYRARDYTSARRYFEQALDIRPDHLPALFNLALVEYHERNFERALAGFQKIVALAESRPEGIGRQMHGLALANVGNLYNHRQLYREAEEALEKAVEIYPGNASAWSNLGISRRRLGKSAEAAEAFRRAHEIDPNDANVMNNLALAYVDSEDWVSAVALLKGATERFPTAANMWLNFGKAQLGLGNEAGALESFEAAIRNDPGNGQGWASAAAVQLAKYFMARSDYARVRTTAERILAWGASSPGYEYLGLAQWKEGDLEGARASFEEARQLDPTQAQTHQNLGGVYLELRQLPQAREALERALAIDPNLEQAKSNLAIIETMRNEPAGGAGLPGSTTASRPPPRSTPPPPVAAPLPPRSRARLGLRFSDVDYVSLGLKGIGVASVVPGTLASRAGIEPQDLILRVDGEDVTSAEQLERYVRETTKTTVVLDLLRNNLPERIELRLE